MTNGQVNSDREAIVSICLGGTDGTELAVDAVVDTGFSGFLTLPDALIVPLGFQRQNTALIQLADGTRKWVEEYEGKIWWNGDWKLVSIQESADDPLLGMALLYDHLLTVEVTDGGEVTIEPLE